jgi:hypothetical protein
MPGSTLRANIRLKSRSSPVSAILSIVLLIAIAAEGHNQRQFRTALGDAAEIGELLKFGGDRRRIDNDGPLSYSR